LKLHLIDILEIKVEGNYMEFEFEFINALLFFLIIPGITIFYLKSNLKNKKLVLKFSSLQIIEKSSNNNKFRKHLPFGITMCILGMMIIALANPQILTPDDVKPINFVIVLDGSESMSATDYSPTRLESAKKSIILVISEMNPKNNVGVILFETGATTISYLTPLKEKTMNAISSIEQTRGSTAIGDGIILGVDMASSIPDKKRVVLLLSDGTHNSGFATTMEATKYAINNNVQIHTVGIGSDKPIFLRNDIYGEPQYVKLDEDTLMNISQQTGGNYFKSSNPKMLEDVLFTINSELEYEMEYDSLRDWCMVIAIVLSLINVYIVYGKYRIAQ
jgi:Ca-activated chloride channel family protein